MPNFYPERPTANNWQFLGDALGQAGNVVHGLDLNLQEAGKNQFEQTQKANLLQDMVEMRIARKKEQERLDWEFQQKKDEEAKGEEARKEINGLIQKGVRVPGASNIIPPKSQMVEGPTALQDEIPTPMVGYHNPNEVTTPGRVETAPDTYRKAGPDDFNEALFRNEQLSGKDYSTSLDPYKNDPMARAYAVQMGKDKANISPNRDVALMAVRKFILGQKAAKKPISKSDLDNAALGADETGMISSDPAYQALVKNYSTDEAVATANKPLEVADPQEVALVAKDLASGAITMQQMRNLTGIGSKGNKTRLAIYQQARQINPDFNAAEFEKSFKAYENVGNQKAIAQINAVRPNIDTIMEMSDKVKRFGMPKVNSMIMAGKYAIGDQSVTTLEEMQHALADELGTALSRSGNFSDAKLALARDLLHTDISEDNFRSNMELLKHMLDNNEKAIKAPMGVYGDGAPKAGPAAGGSQEWVRGADGVLRPKK